MSSAPVVDSQPVEELLLPILEKLENQDYDLPPLPQVANQVLALTTDPNAHAAKLTGLIQQDPVLTSKIFQTANSAACGAQRQIESLQQAIAWLGLNHVAGAAFTLSVQSGVFNVSGYEAEVKDLWKQALATGFCAKAIASQIGQNQDSAFLCGLLHSIGKPFIVHTVNQVQETTLPWSAILQLIDEAYVEVGRQLADAWELPEPVKETINLHQDHAFHLAQFPTLGAPITCLANHLVELFLTEKDVEVSFVLQLPIVKFLNISEEKMAYLLGVKEKLQAEAETMLV